MLAATMPHDERNVRRIGDLVVHTATITSPQERISLPSQERKKKKPNYSASPPHNIRPGVVTNPQKKEGRKKKK